MNNINHFYFNGKWSHEFDWLIVNEISGSVLPPIENNLVEVPGRPGAYHLGRKVKARIETIKISILATDRSDREEKRKVLASWLDTETEKQLKYSYRDDEYMAILDGSTDMERIIQNGETTLTFVVPDPAAIGQTKTQTIAGVKSVKEDVDNQSKWENGTLSGVKATSTGLQLDKEGIDYNPTISNWTGTHSNTEDRNGKLELGGVSTPTQGEYPDDFTGGTNTNVVVDGSNLTITNLPVWDENDNMESWATTGWESRLSTPFTQTADGARAESAGVSAALAKEYAGMQFPQTFEFVYKLTPPSSPQTGFTTKASVYLIETRNSQNYRFSVSLNEATEWTWVRIIITSATTGDIYINGVYDRSISSPSLTSLTPRVQFIIDKDIQQQGILEITQFYKKSGALHSQVPSYDFPYKGTRITPEQDLSSLGSYTSSSISFSTTTPAGFNGFNSSSKLEADLFINGSWQGYQQVSNNGSLPHLVPGDSLDGVKVRLRESLYTYDVANLPTLSDVSFTVEGEDYSYQNSGSYTTLGDSGIQSVVKARQASISWVETKPQDTDIRCFTSIDGNNFEEVSNGGNIPQITPSVDLTAQSLYVRFDLSTTNTEITPSVASYSVDFLSTFKSTGERISNGISLGEVDKAGETLITWDGTPDDSPDIKVFVQLVEDGGTPSENGWLEAQNGFPIPGIAKGDIVTGKTLYSKQVLTSDGKMTPILHRLLWEIQQEGGNIVVYEGTEKAYPVIHIDFVANSGDSFEILHFESGEKILINRSFQSGEKLEINCSKGYIKINGALAMHSLSVWSDFFYLSPGINTIMAKPEGVSIATLEWRERWK